MPVDQENFCKISRFVERDIDLFVAEEICTNPKFSEWFVNQGGGGFDCNHPAVSADISVVEDGSEADVSALFEDDDGNRYRLFVENKIAAQKMPEQLERYVRRASNEVDRGITDQFTIKFFTPGRYADKGFPEFVQHVSFEDAADFLIKTGFDDYRSKYRASLLRSAASSLRNLAQRDTHNAETQPFIKEWWDTVYARLEDRYPGYFIHKTQYPASVYFAPESADFPRSLLRLDFKGHKGEVDLALKTNSVDEVYSILLQTPSLPGSVIKNRKSVSIRIDGLPKFVISDGIVAIEESVMPAYDAAYVLMEYWKKNERTLRDILRA